jgi:hypothetical protein
MTPRRPFTKARCAGRTDLLFTHRGHHPWLECQCLVTMSNDWPSGTPQPPRQMGLSPCKRCSLDFGSKHHGYEPRSQHLHPSVSERHVSRRADCRLGGFTFGIVAAAVWLYILTPLQTATLIMGLGLVVEGYSV